jgi:iron complex outermembrane receptor protein
VQRRLSAKRSRVDSRVPNAFRSITARCVSLLVAVLTTARAQQPDATPSGDRDANGNTIVVEAPKPQDPIADVTEIDRVVVTGTNITTSESPPFVPESIFNREVVERSGSRSLGDFLRSIPQNSGPSFTENQNESLSPGGAAVALRGLGPDATLVLINGRRVAPYPLAQAGITAFVDLNSIPLAAIQQIDILRDGASAIYGTDAIAGVVNVRFLQRFDGTLVTVGYGNTTDTDTRELRSSIISGYTNDERGIELVMVADHFDREALFQRDRYFSESIDQRRLGGTSFLSSVSNPANASITSGPRGTVSELSPSITCHERAG